MKNENAFSIQLKALGATTPTSAQSTLVDFPSQSTDATGAAGKAVSVAAAIERVRIDLESSLDGSVSNSYNRSTAKSSHHVRPRESILALSSAPKWTILHEHRYQMHLDTRKATSRIQRIHNRSSLSAAAVMDIFLTQDAEMVQKLNLLCNDMELTMSSMEKQCEESRRKRGNQESKQVQVNIEVLLPETIERISKKLLERSMTVDGVCIDIGIDKAGFLHFDGWSLLLMILNLPLPDTESSTLFDHLAGSEAGALTRGIAVKQLEKLVADHRLGVAAYSNSHNLNNNNNNSKESSSSSSSSGGGGGGAKKQQKEAKEQQSRSYFRNRDHDHGAGGGSSGGPGSAEYKGNGHIAASVEATGTAALADTTAQQILRSWTALRTKVDQQFDSISEKQKALAERCVSEHIIARKEQNVARYIRKRQEFLRRNVQLQQAYMKMRQKEQEHVEEQRKKNILFHKAKERLLNELRKRNKCVRSGDGGKRNSSGASESSGGRTASIGRRVVERMDRYEPAPFFHDEMSQEQRRKQLKIVQRQQHLSVRRELTGHCPTVKQGADGALSDIRLASCEYALRVHLEGGGVDPGAEEARTTLLLKSSAIVFQRVWRRHLFRRYLWAYGYLRDTHHAYQLFERCVPPPAKSHHGLRRMEDLSFVHDAVPAVTDPRHSHALRPPVDDQSIVADITLVAKLLTDMNLPLSVDKMRQAIVALELSVKKAEDAKSKNNGTPAAKKSPDPMPQKNAPKPGRPQRYGRPKSPQKKKTTTWVYFQLFKKWWCEIIPPPFDATTMVRVLKAAKKQHAREIRANEDEAVAAKRLADAPVIWKNARQKQREESEFNKQMRRTMQELSDHANAAYAQRQAQSKQAVSQRLNDLQRTKAHPPEGTGTVEEETLKMYRVIYDDTEWAPNSKRTQALLSKAGDLHRVRTALHKHRTAVVALTQCHHDEHERSRNHSRMFRKGTAEVIERRHRAMSAKLGSRQSKEDLFVVPRVSSAGKNNESRIPGKKVVKGKASLFDPQYFDAFDPHYLRTSKFEEVRKTSALERSKSESRIEALQNAALHKQRALSLLQLNGRKNEARTVEAAEAGDWATAAEGLPEDIKVSLARNFVREFGDAPKQQQQPQTTPKLFRKKKRRRRRRPQSLLSATSTSATSAIESVTMKKKKPSCKGATWRNELENLCGGGDADFESWGQQHFSN